MEARRVEGRDAEPRGPRADERPPLRREAADERDVRVAAHDGPALADGAEVAVRAGDVVRRRPDLCGNPRLRNRVCSMAYHWLISTLDQTSGAAGTAQAPASSAPVRRTVVPTASGSRRWRTGGVKDGTAPPQARPQARPLDRPGTTPRKRQDAGAMQASRRDFDCHCQTTTCSAAPSRRRTRTATPASSAACSHWPRPRGSTTQRRQGAPSPAFRGRVDGVRWARAASIA